MTSVPKPNIPDWKPTPEAELSDLQFLYPAWRIARAEEAMADGGDVWTAKYLPDENEPFLMEMSAFNLRQKIRDANIRIREEGRDQPAIAEGTGHDRRVRGVRGSGLPARARLLRELGLAGEALSGAAGTAPEAGLVTAGK